MNPCSSEFRALKNFKSLTCKQQILICLITTLLVPTAIFAIPTFRYLVGRCTVKSPSPQPLLDKPLLIGDVDLEARKQISRELVDYEVVGIINVEEKQYGITHSKSDYPILSTHNLVGCFSIVCFDERNHIASLSHHQSLQTMESSLTSYQKHLQEMYTATGSDISEGRFHISIVCGMASWIANRPQELESAQKEIIKLLQTMGAAVLSVHTDIQKSIPGKSIAVDTRTGLVFSHTPVAHQFISTNTTWKPSQKEAAFFTQAAEMHARLKPWITDATSPAAVRAKAELQGMKSSKDLMTVTLADLPYRRNEESSSCILNG